MTNPKEEPREAFPQLFVLEGRQVHKGDMLHVNPAYHARAGTTVKAEYPAGSGWAVCRSDNGAVPDLPIEALSWTPHPDSEDREAIARATNRHGAQVTDRDLEMFRCGRESERQVHAAEVERLRGMLQLKFTEEQCIDLFAAALYISARGDETSVLSEENAERIAEFLCDLSGVDLTAAIARGKT